MKWSVLAAIVDRGKINQLKYLSDKDGVAIVQCSFISFASPKSSRGSSRVHPKLNVSLKGIQGRIGHGAALLRPFWNKIRL